MAGLKAAIYEQDSMDQGDQGDCSGEAVCMDCRESLVLQKEHI